MLPYNGVASNKDLMKIEHWTRSRLRRLAWSVASVPCIMVSQHRSRNTKIWKWKGIESYQDARLITVQLFNMQSFLLQHLLPKISEINLVLVQGTTSYLLGEGHYWQTRVLLSLKSCEYSDVCSGASRHQPDILLKLLNWKGRNLWNLWNLSFPAHCFQKSEYFIMQLLNQQQRWLFDI